MKIIISEKGHLYIFRGNRYREQYCPYSALDSNGFGARCGDWCPMFGEPRMTSVILNEGYLDVCHGNPLRGEPLMDEREKKESK